MPFVSELELARTLKRDRRAVRLAVETGRLTRREDGLFDLDTALREWNDTTQHEKGHNNRSTKLPGEIPAPDIPLRTETKSTDYAKARAGSQVYDALTKKVRYEKLVGNLTPTADVEAARFTEFRVLREACFNIPSRIAALVATETDVSRCQALLEMELNTVFNAFADGKLS